MLCVVLTA